MMNLDEHAHEAYVDSGTGAVVVSEVDPEEVMRSIGGKDFAGLNPMVSRALASWAEETQTSKRRGRGLFQRDKYVTPSKVIQQMAMAYDSLDDDIIGNVADSSESLAFQKISFEVPDKDQEDVWNQIGRDLNLDNFLRVAWRELFTVSQFYSVMWWGKKTYRVRGIRSARKARKEFRLTVPTSIGFLDPTRIVPVSADLFGGAKLAWIGSDADNSLLDSVASGLQTDRLVERLFVGKYKPTPKEAQDLAQEGISTDNLILLNPKAVWRHTLTKSPFERWARVRMKSLFSLLDLKHQLREMDRAWLLGGINFIVLVTRGTDQIPTTITEVAETSAQVRGQSRGPIIVTDHRINIEIITPDVSAVLERDKWQVLDERINMRLWGTFQTASDSGNRETSLTLAKVISRGLQSRRHMLKRAIEFNIVRAVTDVNDVFNEEARLEFSPRRIELEFDPNVVTLIQELRDRGDLSRETTLTELGFDQSLEAMRREYEDERYGDTFTAVNVPFDSPNKTTPSGSGKKGGRPKEDTTNQDGEGT